MNEHQTPPEIACDESGSEGENIVAAAHPVFVHASVNVDHDDAKRILEELRKRAPSRAAEYKAEHLLRSRSVAVLEWFLGEDGVAGRANAYLIDKHYFVVGKVIDLIVEEVAHERGVDLYTSGQAREMAMNLAVDGPRVLGTDWPPVLAAFNSLARATQRRGVKATVEDFFSMISSALSVHKDTPVSDVLRLVLLGRSHAESLAGGLSPDPPSLVGCVSVA